jgi:hypothetical protein
VRVLAVSFRASTRPSHRSRRPLQGGLLIVPTNGLHPTPLSSRTKARCVPGTDTSVPKRRVSILQRAPARTWTNWGANWLDYGGSTVWFGIESKHPSALSCVKWRFCEGPSGRIRDIPSPSRPHNRANRSPLGLRCFSNGTMVKTTRVPPTPGRNFRRRRLGGREVRLPPHCAQVGGFNLHAGVVIGLRQRQCCRDWEEEDHRKRDP